MRKRWFRFVLDVIEYVKRPGRQASQQASQQASAHAMPPGQPAIAHVNRVDAKAKGEATNAIGILRTFETSSAMSAYMEQARQEEPYFSAHDAWPRKEPMALGRSKVSLTVKSASKHREELICLTCLFPKCTNPACPRCSSCLEESCGRKGACRGKPNTDKQNAVQWHAKGNCFFALAASRTYVTVVEKNATRTFWTIGASIASNVHIQHARTCVVARAQLAGVLPVKGRNLHGTWSRWITKLWH